MIRKLLFGPLLAGRFTNVFSGTGAAELPTEVRVGTGGPSVPSPPPPAMEVVHYVDYATNGSRVFARCHACRCSREIFAAHGTNAPQFALDDLRTVSGITHVDRRLPARGDA